MDASVEGVGRFRIDVPLTYDAAKGRLDMACRASEPVVQIEMPESGIEIVAPKQADHAPPQPEALRISRGAAQ